MSSSPPSLARIADVFDLARADVAPGGKSVHWDVFPSDYGVAIRNPEHWRTFLRNALSYGFNDSLYFSGEAQALMSGRVAGAAVQTDVDPARHIRTDHDYRPLLPERLDTARHREQMAKIGEVFSKVVQICGVDFLLANLAPPVGSPSVAALTFSYGDSAERTVAVNYHDLHLVYYAWLIDRAAAKVLDGGPRDIVEIGAGYGGLSAKLKDLYPASRVILFDLPEVNAVQTHYLVERFSGCTFRLYDDFKKSGADIFHDRSADFIILPGWAIAELPDTAVDLAVNIRSMMEMSEATIADYFRHLHRTVRPGGLFACFNRYVKEPGVRLKSYPFDDRWQILLSQTSNLQSHVHELLTLRTELPQRFTVTDALRSLAPF